MKIDTTQIENYDTMSAEEKLAALEGYEFEEPTQDNKWKEAVNKATAEAAKYKKELREKQSEAERLEAERKEEAEKKDAMLKELLREKTLAEHKANFLKEGYGEELANQSATALADGDFKTLFSNLNTFLVEREKTIKEDLMKKTPTPKSGNETKDITKEQFNKMSFTERNKLYMENQELYESLKGE